MVGSIQSKYNLLLAAWRRERYRPLVHDCRQHLARTWWYFHKIFLIIYFTSFRYPIRTTTAHHQCLHGKILANKDEVESAKRSRKKRKREIRVLLFIEFDSNVHKRFGANDTFALTMSPIACIVFLRSQWQWISTHWLYCFSLLVAAHWW